MTLDQNPQPNEQSLLIVRTFDVAPEVVFDAFTLRISSPLISLLLS
jgi:hypothetical protein